MNRSQNMEIMEKNSNKIDKKLFYPIIFCFLYSLYIKPFFRLIFKHYFIFIYIIYMVKKAAQDKPAPPKRALSAFFLFREEVYDKVKSQNPGASITDLTKIISEMWKKVDPATKERLEKTYQTNKEKVAQQKAAYIEQYGKIEKKKKKKHTKKQ